MVTRQLQVRAVGGQAGRGLCPAVFLRLAQARVAASVGPAGPSAQRVFGWASARGLSVGPRTPEPLPTSARAGPPSADGPVPGSVLTFTLWALHLGPLSPPSVIESESQRPQPGCGPPSACSNQVWGWQELPYVQSVSPLSGPGPPTSPSFWPLPRGVPRGGVLEGGGAAVLSTDLLIPCSFLPARHRRPCTPPGTGAPAPHLAQAPLHPTWDRSPTPHTPPGTGPPAPHTPPGTGPPHPTPHLA